MDTLIGIKRVRSNAFNKSKRRNKIAGTTLRYLALCIIAAFFIFPFFVMICLSLLPNSDINLQVLFSPSRTVNIGTYLTVLKSGSNYMSYFFNSLKVSLITAAGIPLVSSLCAYGFAKVEFKGRNLMFGIVLSTLMIPAVICLVPLYAIYSRIGWVNTLYPMWVPSLFGGGATNIFLVRQYMRGIPDDMMKAAKLDGANSFLIYWKIIMPLCLPICLYVAVMSFMGTWKDFMTPYTYLSGDSPKITLALGIFYDFGPGSMARANSAMAAGVVMIMPCAVLFFIFQRWLLDGVALTGIKG